MGKSLDEIVRQMEIQRQHQINEERKHQENIQREAENRRREYQKKMLNESLFSNATPTSSSSAGIIRQEEEIILTEPIVETVSAEGLFTASFNATGNIISDGGSPILNSGFIWSPYPDVIMGVSPSYTFDSEFTEIGEFSESNISVGDPGVIYVRAWAQNEIGYGYGENIEIEVNICLAKGTKVLLSSGLYKLIEDINYNDKLLVWNFDDGVLDESKPLWIKKPQTTNKYNLLSFSDGTQLKTISQHRIFNKEAGCFTYPMTDDTPIGTTTINNFGEEVTLINKEVIFESVEYYNIITNKHINIFAESILTSCRYNNIYKIEDMKFIKDNVVLRPRHEFYNISDEFYYGLRLSEQSFSIEEIERYVNRLEKLQLLKHESIVS